MAAVEQVGAVRVEHAAEHAAQLTDRADRAASPHTARRAGLVVAAELLGALVQPGGRRPG